MTHPPPMPMCEVCFFLIKCSKILHIWEPIMLHILYMPSRFPSHYICIGNNVLSLSVHCTCVCRNIQTQTLMVVDLSFQRSGYNIRLANTLVQLCFSLSSFPPKLFVCFFLSSLLLCNKKPCPSPSLSTFFLLKLFLQSMYLFSG